MERIEASQYPPTPRKPGETILQPRQRRQKALWHFPAMSATIQRNSVPDFSGARLQGVKCDSPDGFKDAGRGKYPRVARIRRYILCTVDTLYGIYIILYHMQARREGLGVQ